MLLDEDPATLISHTITNFSLHPDKSALSRISSTLSTLSQSRQTRLSTASSELSSLHRRAQALKNNHSETVADHHDKNHAESIMGLDAQKFRVAKQARDAEEESERLEGALEDLRGKLEQLDMEGLTGKERQRRPEEDATLLRLKLYRTLGIDFEHASTSFPEKGTPSEKTFDKAIIRNMKKGDVHVVTLDPKFSRFWYARLFWSAMDG